MVLTQICRQSQYTLKIFIDTDMDTNRDRHRQRHIKSIHLQTDSGTLCTNGLRQLKALAQAQTLYSYLNLPFVARLVSETAALA